MNNLGAIVAGLFVGAGLLGAGWFAAGAVSDFKNAQRYVTVKGLAEREVAADLAIWPVVFNAAGNDLSKVQDEIEADADKVIAFLANYGLQGEAVTRSAPRIEDYLARGYSGGNRPENRYAAEATVLLRSTNIAAVKQAQQDAGKLVREGVVLLNQWGAQTQFLFTQLNTIKPAMIAEATQAARAAAAKFADDSGARVGGIRQANQGLVTISDRDAHTPDIKKVRVVSTVDYFLIGD